jgi:replicative DNA helicase
MLERIPPQNIEAEMAVLGAMLLGERAAIERASELLLRDDFYREAHARIYEAMLAISEKGEPVDIVTLSEELQRRNHLELVGGLAYMMQLGEFVPTTSNVTYYARIVQQKAILRKLIETSSEIAGLAYQDPDNVDVLVDQAEKLMLDVGQRRRQ